MWVNLNMFFWNLFSKTILKLKNKKSDQISPKFVADFFLILFCSSNSMNVRILEINLNANALIIPMSQLGF